MSIFPTQSESHLCVFKLQAAALSYFGSQERHANTPSRGTTLQSAQFLKADKGCQGVRTREKRAQLS